jgi:hypothetical protein
MNAPTSLKATASAGGDVENTSAGMSPQAATRVEFALIGLSIIALLLIFQPFSLALFGIGCGVVVVSGLANNLLPLCEPGVPIRALINTGLIVGGIFFVVLIIAIASAYLYGRVFIGP